MGYAYTEDRFHDFTIFICPCMFKHSDSFKLDTLYLNHTRYLINREHPSPKV